MPSLNMFTNTKEMFPGKTTASMYEKEPPAKPRNKTE
jgi:hypothetical protein